MRRHLTVAVLAGLFATACLPNAAQARDENAGPVDPPVMIPHSSPIRPPCRTCVLGCFGSGYYPHRKSGHYFGQFGWRPWGGRSGFYVRPYTGHGYGH